MKKVVFKVIIMSFILIFLLANYSFAKQNWEKISVDEYKKIDDSTCISYVLELGDAKLETEAQANAWLERYEAIKSAGESKRKRNGDTYWVERAEQLSGASYLSKLSGIEETAKGFKDGNTTTNNNEQTSYNGKTDWKDINVSDYQNVTDVTEFENLLNLLENANINKMTKAELMKYVNCIYALRSSPACSTYDYNNNNSATNRLDRLNRAIDGDEEAMEKIKGTEEGKMIENSAAANTSAGGVITKVNTIYKLPEKIEGNSVAESLDNMITEGESFINNGEVKYGDGLVDFSGTVYNIFLTIGIVISVIVGAIIGVKLMISGIEGKVEAKNLLIPYVIGCVIIFGGFGIWKLFVTIFQTM